MIDKTVTVDVREDIQNGHEPFSRIMGTIAELAPEEDLLLIAPFEPKPLFGILMKKGFQHRSKEVAPGRWEVLFSRSGNGDSTIRNAVRTTRDSSPMSDNAVAIVEVDARGLEPPQPMVKILEAIAALPNGAELRARTNRRPIHLYPHLEERGFVGESEEENDGSFVTHIRRAG